MMDVNALNLAGWFCGLSYFEESKQKIANPTADQIDHALDRLQQQLDRVTRTVELWRMPVSSSLTDQFCLQIQGERNRFLISLSRDFEMFATPDFDIVSGDRGQLSVIGNLWPSRLVCTDYKICLEIALQFGLNGKIARPEIWEAVDDE